MFVKSKCNCDLIKKVVKHKDLNMLCVLFKAFNDTYVTIKTQILLMEPLPSINCVFSLVI